LGNEYAIYVDSFKKNNINGSSLLNDTNEGSLINYGVKDKRHRQCILKSLEKLRKEASGDTPTKKK
jgi:hypothetical protein